MSEKLLKQHLTQSEAGELLGRPSNQGFSIVSKSGHFSEGDCKLFEVCFGHVTNTGLGLRNENVCLVKNEKHFIRNFGENMNET